MDFSQLRSAASSFFAINDVIVQFVHGQVFLVLGVAMGLQWRQRSEVALGKALPWLSAWGLGEAVATWGNSFIPIQQQLLNAETIEVLRLLQLAAHLFCFVSLLGFGFKLVERHLPQSAVTLAPVALFISGMAAICLIRLVVPGKDYASFNSQVEAVLRYAICFPAAILVALGLRQQAIQLLGPFDTGSIVSSLRLAGIGFLLYALVEGLLVPESELLFAPWLNTRTFSEVFILPVGIARAAVCAGILFFFFRALEVFRIEADRSALALRQQQFLVADRERISRDLHDGTIQGIYAAGLMLEGLKLTLNGQDKAVDQQKAKLQIENVGAVLHKTIEDVRGYIHDLRAGGAGEDMARGLVEIVTEFRIRTGMQAEWRSEGTPAWTVPPEMRQHVYQIAREALSNVTRHARATRVQVRLTYGSSVQLSIGDNGQGHIPLRTQVGRGLANMRERAALLKGSLDIAATPGEGTTVTLTLWPN